MYESYWHLRAKPFEDIVGGDFYYPGQTHQAALLKLRYAIENHRAAALLAGASGLGKTLFEVACDTVRSAGHQWMWLCVSDINERAKAFYKKHAFEPVGPGPVFEVGSDRLTSTVMALRMDGD